MGYAKLFESILDSTVWQEDLHVKVVWITMLAMKDPDGIVEASIPGLAKRAGVTIPQCEEALEKFLAPDKYSRTPDHEGRRIEVVDGGWRLLNADKYRDKLDAEDQRAKATERMRRHRERHRAKGYAGDAGDAPVTPVTSQSRPVRHTDTDTDLDLPEDLSGSGSGPASRPELPDPPAIVGAESRGGGEVGAEPVDLRLREIPARSREDRRRKLFNVAWQFAGIQLVELEREGYTGARPGCWGGLPSASSAEAKALFARIDELTVSDADWGRAEEIIRNRVLVAAARARAERGTGFFTPAWMWHAEHFALAKDMNPDDVSRMRARRDGSRGTQHDEPVRRIKTL